MRPAYNFQPQYRVTMLIREDWTEATGAPPAVKGLVWFTDGSKMREETVAGVYVQSVGRRLSFSLDRYATVSQAEICAILACAYEIQSQNRPEKYVSICSDGLAALKALNAFRTTSPLVRQCQKTLNDITIRHAVGLFWVPGHAGIRGNEIADGLARGEGGIALRFLGPEPALGVSRLNLSIRPSVHPSIHLSIYLNADMLQREVRTKIQIQLCVETTLQLQIIQWSDFDTVYS